MSPRVRGTLDGQDVSDTYTFWRKPGTYRYELNVRGEGAVGLLLEALHPGGEGAAGSAAGWKTIEDRSCVRTGSHLMGSAVVPEVRIDSDSKAEWVELRLRITRAEPLKAVEYEFFLEPGGLEFGPAPQKTSR